MKLEFKKTALAAIRPDPDRILNFWDIVTPGLCLRVTPAGAKTFVFKYRHGGRQVWHKLGRFGDLTLEQARRRALEARVTVSDGGDPGQAVKTRRSAMTLKEAALRMLEEHGPLVRPRTLRNYGQLVRDEIVPTLGRLRLADLTPSDVAKLHHGLRATPRKANHALVVLSLICKYAERWGERPLGSNPCQHQRAYKTAARHRYLNEEEIQAIGGALAELGARLGVEADIIRLIMLTGARKGEILNLRWEQVDLDNARLLFDPAEHKTGGVIYGKQIPLGASAVALLDGLGRDGLWVFPSSVGRPRFDVKKAWQAVRSLASKGGIDVRDVRIHDLRHTWGAMATSGGHALQTIGAVMGHRNASTTARYAHVAPSPAARAVEETSQRIADALGGKPKPKPKSQK